MVLPFTKLEVQYQHDASRIINSLASSDQSSTKLDHENLKSGGKKHGRSVQTVLTSRSKKYKRNITWKWEAERLEQTAQGQQWKEDHNFRLNNDKQYANCMKEKKKIGQ